MLNFVSEKVFLRGVFHHHFNVKKASVERHRTLFICQLYFDIVKMESTKSDNYKLSNPV